MHNDPDTTLHLEGKLLLADPSLRDGFFNKSVILLAEHTSDEGTYGLILNQPTGQKVGDLLKSPEFAELANIPVHIGGPIGQEHLTFAALWIHGGDTLKFATQISAADAIRRTHQPGTLVRAFAGYSGWSAGQLEGELRKNSWIPTIPTSNMLASTHGQELWADLLRRISPFHKILAEAPDDIFVN